MVQHRFFNPVAGVALIASLLSASVWSDSSIVCNFNELSDGIIDGQPGWDVFEKGQDSSAFTVVSEVGTSEASNDRALVIKSTDDSIRCVTDEAVRWRRAQTVTIEFDLRVMLPQEEFLEDRPVMILLMGNSVLSETARWEIRLDAKPDGSWNLSAALPDKVSQLIPAEKIAFSRGKAAAATDWMHCVVEVEKRSRLDSFSASVKLQDKTGKTIARLICADDNKDRLTKTMWSLSRLHAGFLSSRDIHGLSCIDNFQISTTP
jgi:hypothetical protein